MRDCLFRKGLVLAIIIFFIGMSVFPSIGIGVNNSCLVNDSIIDINPRKIPDEWDINISLNGTLGDNGWYISCVTIIITYDNETIKHVYVGGEIYIEPVIICEEGVILVEIGAEDWEGNLMEPITFEFAIDYTPPIVDLIFQIVNGRWVVSVICSDDISGISRVEFYIDGSLKEVVHGPPYIWIFTWPYPPPYGFFKVVAFDTAGNSESSKPCYSSPRKMYIFGFIHNAEFSEGYLTLYADYIITIGYYGIIKSQKLTFEIYKYSGYIGKNFIMAKIWAWWIPIPKEKSL